MDRECFAKEVEACTGLMYRVAYTILQNDDDCQDAVQDALLKAWSKLNSLREEKYFRTWITRILINTCHDLVQKRSRLVSLDTLPELAEAFPDPALAMALERLPEKLRMPLMLFYSENMTYAEISKALRIPTATVQSRIHRGKTHTKLNLKLYHLWASFTPWRCFIPVNVALLRLPPFSLATAQNPSQI